MGGEWSNIAASNIAVSNYAGSNYDVISLHNQQYTTTHMSVDNIGDNMGESMQDLPKLI